MHQSDKKRSAAARGGSTVATTEATAPAVTTEISESDMTGKCRSRDVPANNNRCGDSGHAMAQHSYLLEGMLEMDIIPEPHSQARSEDSREHLKRCLR